jgi:hypothetical protein
MGTLLFRDDFVILADCFVRVPTDKSGFWKPVQRHVDQA